MSETVSMCSLLSPMTQARDALVAYIQRRRAQGTIAVSENDRLRHTFFALARLVRGQGASEKARADREMRIALHHAEEALSAAALCLMSGRYDCASYIAVNVDKLERSLDVLNYCIRSLSECESHAQA